MSMFLFFKRLYHSRPVLSVRIFLHNSATLIKAFIEFLAKGRKNYNDFLLGNNVKLYYWKLSKDSENLGDYLSKVVVSHLQKEQQTMSNFASKNPSRTLYAIGSILGFRCQNAVVWGSGLLNPDSLYLNRLVFSSLDIRSVRGPKTREALLSIGKQCPAIYGDPAILMPLIYMPKDNKKTHDVSLILHFSNNDFFVPEGKTVNTINIITTDYRNEINQIVQSTMVISSSLHGIILAEAYGVPAVLLLKEDQSTFKYEDWYHSTGRYSVVIAHTLKEALSVKPMELPDLRLMQENVLQAFPSDLWGLPDTGN